MNRLMSTFSRALLGWGLLLTLLGSAHAAVQRSGDWPADERVSLSAVGVSRSEAVRRLAANAAWSLVASDLGEEKLDLEVRDQPAAEVLEVLLKDGDFIAERRGSLVAIHRAPNATTPPPVAAPVAPPPGKKGEDRVVTEETRVGREEVVRDLVVWRAHAVVEGTVTGSVLVLGGSVQLLPGAYVREDIFGVGSSVDLQNGAQIDGEVTSLFGSLQKGDRVEVACPLCDDEAPLHPVAAFFKDFFEKLAGVSLLWVVGAILLATTLGRVELVSAALQQRPFRSIGIGFVSVLALLLVIVTLAVTLIGIPLAVLLALVSVLIGYLSFCVIPFTLGSKLFTRFTKNPYLLLAYGCTVLFFVQLIPGIGDLLSFVAGFAALGAVVTTRGAGLFTRRDERTTVSF